MDVNLGVTWSGVLLALAAGGVLAAAYDVLRLVRMMLSGHNRHVVIQDFFFMLLAAFVTYLVCLAASAGMLRFYVVACEIIGACVYFLSIGLVTARIARGVYVVCRTVWHFLRRFFFRPILAFFRRIAGWIWRKCTALQKVTKKCQKNHTNPLKPKPHLVYNLFIGLRRQKGTHQGKGGSM